MCLLKEIDSDFCLQEEEIPSGFGKCWVDTGKNGDEVFFEGSDCLLGFVPSVHVWGNLLV